MTSIEAMEAKLDGIAAEALRREARRLDAANASRAERAAAMAKTRVKLKTWRDRATGAALCSAVSAGRSA